MNKKEQRSQAHTDMYIQYLKDAVARAGGPKPNRKITTAEEVEEAMSYWDRRKSKLAYLVAPEMGYKIHTLFSFIAEMAPHTDTETHRHFNEAIIYFLEGSGQTILNLGEETVDWKAGDTLSVPQWTWHRHINPTDARVRYLAVTNEPLVKSLGVYKIEDYGPDVEE